jgi:hypothetical protein
MVPEPEIIDPELLEVVPEEAGGAGGAALGGAGAVLGGGAVPPVMGDAEPVPFWAMAICWNIAWVLFAVGLIENVIPLPQWPFCLQ